MIGLGRMGANMVRRVMSKGHECVVYDAIADAVARVVANGRGRRRVAAGDRRQDVQAARRLADGAGRHRRQGARPTWSRTSSRATPSSTAATRITTTTSPRRSASRSGIHYVDVGTSGGVWGLERGYCMMIGGEPAARAPDADLPDAGSGHRRRRRTPGRSGDGDDRRARLPALRSGRRWPLRKDGAQRHRVRDHGRVRRGHEHPPARQRRQAACARPTPRPRRCASRALQYDLDLPTSPKSGAAAA